MPTISLISGTTQNLVAFDSNFSMIVGAATDFKVGAAGLYENTLSGNNNFAAYSGSYTGGLAAATIGAFVAGEYYACGWQDSSSGVGYVLWTDGSLTRIFSIASGAFTIVESQSVSFGAGDTIGMSWNPTSHTMTPMKNGAAVGIFNAIVDNTFANLRPIINIRRAATTGATFSNFILPDPPSAPLAPSDITFTTTTDSFSATIIPANTGAAPTTYAARWKLASASTWTDLAAQASAVFEVTGRPSNALFDFEGWGIASALVGASRAEQVATDNPGAGGGILGDTSAVIIISNGGGATASVSVSENTTAITTVLATGAGVITYVITGGADASMFAIGSASGILTFISAPDFESPSDAGADNIYNVIITASNGSTSDTQSIGVTITNVADSISAITIISATTVSQSVRTSFNVLALAVNGSTPIVGFDLELIVSEQGVINFTETATTNGSGIANFTCNIPGTTDPGSSCSLRVRRIADLVSSSEVNLIVVPSPYGDIFFRGEWWPRVNPVNS